MKKTYIKPSLHVELFEVDAIMTGEIQSPSDLLAIPFNVETDGGTINFADTTLNSINYQDFMNQNQ